MRLLYLICIYVYVSVIFLIHNIYLCICISYLSVHLILVNRASPTINNKSFPFFVFLFYLSNYKTTWFINLIKYIVK